MIPPSVVDEFGETLVTTGVVGIVTVTNTVFDIAPSV